MVEDTKIEGQQDGTGDTSSSPLGDITGDGDTHVDAAPSDAGVGDGSPAPAVGGDVPPADSAPSDSVSGGEVGAGEPAVTATPNEEKSDETHAVQEKEEGREGLLMFPEEIAKMEGHHFLVSFRIHPHDLGLKPKFTEAKVVEGVLVNMWDNNAVDLAHVESLQNLGVPTA